MSKKRKQRVRSTPWWRKHGLPAVFGSMLDAASKDDADAMLAAVKGFCHAFPKTDLFDPDAGGFRVPGEVLFESQPFQGVMVGFGEACIGLHALDCLFVASATCLRNGQTKGIRLFFDQACYTAADSMSEPPGEIREAAHFMSEALDMTMQRLVGLSERTGIRGACEAAFAGTHAQPFWKQAVAMVLAEQEDRMLYEESRPPQPPGLDANPGTL